MIRNLFLVFILFFGGCKIHKIKTDLTVSDCLDRFSDQSGTPLDTAILFDKMHFKNPNKQPVINYSFYDSKQVSDSFIFFDSSLFNVATFKMKKGYLMVHDYMDCMLQSRYKIMSPAYRNNKTRIVSILNEQKQIVKSYKFYLLFGNYSNPIYKKGNGLFFTNLIQSSSNAIKHFPKISKKEIHTEVDNFVAVELKEIGLFFDANFNLIVKTSPKPISVGWIEFYDQITDVSYQLYYKKDCLVHKLNWF